MDLSALEIFIGLLASFVAAVVQASIGFGFAVVSIPILAVVHPDFVPVPQLLLTFPLAVLTFARERVHVDFSGVRWITVGWVIGGAAALPLLKVFTGTARELTMGLIVLLMVVGAASRATVNITPRTQVATGVASGVIGLLASMGGAPVALLYRDQKGPRLRSSMAGVFLIGLTIIVILRILSREITSTDLWISLMLLPAILAGFAVSGSLTRHIDKRGLRNWVLGVSAIAAVTLIAKAAFF